MRIFSKLLITASLVVQTFAGFSAYAVNDTVEIDGITYLYNINHTGSATVSSGAHASGDIVIPSTITVGGAVYNVELIEEKAFYENSAITSLVIGEGVTKIGELAFANCTSLETVKFPESLVTLDHACFERCSVLKVADLPGNLITVGRWAFSRTALESVVFPASVTSVLDYSFSHTNVETVELPATIKEIKEGVFSDCTNLKKAVIGVSEIPYISFDNCNALEEVELLEGVKTLGNNCFNCCEGLTSIHIPSSVTTIKDVALGNTGLRSLFIPPTVTSLSTRCVSGCDYLQKMAYPSNFSTPSIGQFGKATPVFIAYQKHNSLIEDGYIYDSAKTKLYYVPLDASGEFTIPSTVTSVEPGAFAGCSEITSLVVPGTVNTINQGAFKGCGGLSTISFEYAENNISIYPLSNGVSAFMETSVETLFLDRGISSVNLHVFLNNETLKNVNIGRNIKVLNPCLRDCTGIESISIPANVEEIGYSALSLPNLKNLVLEECEDPIIFHQLELDKCSLTTFKMGRPIQAELPERFFLNKTLQSVEVGGYVKAIPKWFFKDQTLLTDAKLEEGVETIGEFAFTNTALEEIDFPSTLVEIGIGAFMRVPLKSLEFPEQPFKIGGSAFSGCGNLKSLTLPSRATLEDGCFSDTGIESLVIENGVTELKYSSFSDCKNLIDIDLPSTLREFPRAFAGCTSLASVMLPEGLTSISVEAFSGCSALADVNFPSSLESIGEQAFQNCKSLTNLAFNPDLSTIDDYAFSGCEGLTEIILPSGLSKIEKNTFSSCKNLIKIAYPSGIQNAPKALYTVEYTGKMTAGDNGCYYQDQSLLYAPLTIKGALAVEAERIGNYAFAGCGEIESIDLSINTAVIGNNAFENCTSLNDVKLGPALEEIRDYAFIGCSGLSYIDIPGTVSNIGKYILEKCTSLTGFTVPAEANYETRLGSDMYKFQLGLFILDDVTASSVSLIYYERNTALDMTFVDRTGTAVYPAIMIDGEVKKLYFGYTYVIDGLTAETYVDVAGMIRNVPTVFFDIPKVQTADRSTVDYKVYCDKLIVNLDLYVDDVRPENDSYSTYSHLRLDLGNGNVRQYDIYPNRINEIPLPFYNRAFDIVASVSGEIIASGEPYYFSTDEVTLKVPMPNFGVPSATPTSTSSVRFSVTSNFYNDAENVGFEWRRHDAPDMIASNYDLCTTVEGRMVGSLRGVDGNVYYKVRPFYRYGNGSDYIVGEWIAFYTGDADVYFEPEMETLPVESISSSEATLQCMALEGTDEIESQGIEYRPVSVVRSAKSKYASAAEWITVPADGVLMTVNLRDLEPGMEYEYRAYAVTASGTYHSEPQTFRTEDGGSTTSIKELENGELVFKSGVTSNRDVFIIASGAGEELFVSLYSLNGAAVYEGYLMADSSSHELGLSLNPGLYILRVSNGNDILSTKLFVR